MGTTTEPWSEYLKAVNFDDLKESIRNGNINVNKRDKQGRTLLHAIAELPRERDVAEGGNASIVHYLMEKGTDINAVDNEGNTPIMLALEKEDINQEFILAITHSNNDSNNNNNSNKYLSKEHIKALLEKGNIFGDTFILRKNKKNWFFYTAYLPERIMELSKNDDEFLVDTILTLIRSLASQELRDSYMADQTPYYHTAVSLLELLPEKKQNDLVLSVLRKVEAKKAIFVAEQFLQLRYNNELAIKKDELITYNYESQDAGLKQIILDACLVQAIKQNKLHKAKILLEKGANPNCEYGEKSYYCLKQAFNKKDAKKWIEPLIEKGGDILADLPNILAKIERENVIELTKFVYEKIVQSSYDETHKQTMYGSLVHAAASRGSIDALKFLVDQNIDINYREEPTGFTPLHYAFKRMRVGVAEFLLKNGADINIKDAKGCSPMDYCLSELDRYYLFITRILANDNILEKISREQLRDIIGSIIICKFTYLDRYYMRNHRLEYDIYNYRCEPAELLKVLLKKESYGEEFVYSVFCQAVFDSNQIALGEKHRAVSKIISILKDIKYYNANKLLDFFIGKYKDVEATKLVIENSEYSSGILEVALAMAVRHKNKDLLEGVLSIGRQINFDKFFGNIGDTINNIDTANFFIEVYQACNRSRPEISNFLIKSLKCRFENVAKGLIARIEKQDKVSALINLANENKKEEVELLLKLDPELIRALDNGNTALHSAIIDSKINAVRIIADIYLNLNAKNAKGDWMLNVKNASGDSPLHLAINKKKGKDTIMALITRGADLELRDCKNCTPLHLAATYGGEEIVENLYYAGADIEAEDNNGNTPLHLAIINGHRNIVSTLIKLGADISVKNNEGDTALHLAIRKLEEDFVKDIITAKVDVRAKNNNGDTALHAAVTRYMQVVAQTLIQFGADKYAENNKHETPKLLADCMRYSSMKTIVAPNWSDWFYFYYKAIKDSLCEAIDLTFKTAEQVFVGRSK